MSASEITLELLDLRARELDQLPATLADQVFVVGRSGEVLIPLEPFAEIMLPHKAAVDEEVERAVDGGLTDKDPPAVQPLHDLLDADVLVGRKERLGDLGPLLGHREIVGAQVLAEFFDCGHVMVPRKPTSFSRVVPHLPGHEGVDVVVPATASRVSHRSNDVVPAAEMPLPVVRGAGKTRAISGGPGDRGTVAGSLCPTSRAPLLR